MSSFEVSLSVQPHNIRDSIKIKLNTNFFHNKSHPNDIDIDIKGNYNIN